MNRLLLLFILLVSGCSQPATNPKFDKANILKGLRAIYSQQIYYREIDLQIARDIAKENEEAKKNENLDSL